MINLASKLPRSVCNIQLWNAHHVTCVHVLQPTYGYYAYLYIQQGLEGLERFWLGHSWAGLRGGGGGAEQWECSIGTVRENLGWSRRVWSAPPLAHPAFVQLRKLSALPTDSNNKPSQLGSLKPVYCTSRQREAKSVTSPLHILMNFW